MAFNLASLRVRLLLAALLWVGLATVILGVAISQFYSATLTHQFRHDLRAHMVELVALADVDARGMPVLRHPMADPRFGKAKSGLYWQIERPGFGRISSATLGTRRLSGQFAKATRREGDWTAGPGGIVMEYGLILPVANGPPLRLAIAGERRVLARQLENFDRTLTLALLVFALLMVAGAMLQIFYGLRPVARIGDAVEELRCGHIARLPDSVPTEFRALVDRMNALIDAQTALVQRARVEAGNLAHGLRTPLALVTDEAEVLARGGNETAAAFILAECARMQRHIDYRMSRASAAGARSAGTVAALVPLIDGIVAAMRRMPATRHLDIVVDVPEMLEVDCDPADLSEILSNLIDNACKWAATSIRIHAAPVGAQVAIDVIDDGPGIAPALRDAVFDVGRRLDESKAGRGLGLAIARDIAGLYGGTVTLGDAPGGGLHGRVTL